MSIVVINYTSDLRLGPSFQNSCMKDIKNSRVVEH